MPVCQRSDVYNLCKRDEEQKNKTEREREKTRDETKNALTNDGKKMKSSMMNKKKRKKKKKFWGFRYTNKIKNE